MIIMTEIGYYYSEEGRVHKEYIYGMDRGERGRYKITHLYEVIGNSDYLPMCSRGRNRGKYGYSIFRGNLSNKGVCKFCYRRAKLGLGGLEYKE